MRLSLVALSVLLCGGLALAALKPLLRGAGAQGDVAHDDALHDGPGVAEGLAGPARFVDLTYAGFDTRAAMASTRFVDQYYRAPGNEGYNASLDHVAARLRAVGFGELEGFSLREIETPLSSKAWTPRSAKLEVSGVGGEGETLHAFSKPGDHDRVMLPINAPSADVEGPVAFDLASLEQGGVLVTGGALAGRTLRAAHKKGAVLVLSSSVNDFTVDHRDSQEHLDAILFSAVSASTRIPVGKISQRVHERLTSLAAETDGLRVHFQAEVEWTEGPLRTLVATVLGSSKPKQAIAIASHVQEPGAGDNASGVAGLVEDACTLARLIQQGELQRPARSIVFLWGDEMRQSAVWLANTELEVIAGISADMLGQANAETGAVCLIERSPDPGALDTLLPDKHTPWGAGRVREEDLVPNGLALIARVALHDVARVAGGWKTAENPWEGGSDHDVFLAQGIPGILIWHFTDFTYHTGLDRMSRLDGEELRRTSIVVLATALAVADLRQADLDRYLLSDAIELELRVASAEAASRPDVAKRWREWSHGVGAWLRDSCVDRK